MEFKQYLKSIVRDSVIVRDEIKSINTNVEELKMERNEFKKLVLKIVDVHISMFLQKLDCCKTFAYYVG